MSAETYAEEPPLNLPRGGFAVIRSHGELIKWRGHVWRWDATPLGRRWLYVKALPSKPEAPVH